MPKNKANFPSEGFPVFWGRGHHAR